jgi:hypothetical protein
MRIRIRNRNPDGTELYRCIYLQHLKYSMHAHIYQNLADLFSAAICLLKGGHTIILNAFDFFKLVCTYRTVLVP